MDSDVMIRMRPHLKTSDEDFNPDRKAQGWGVGFMMRPHSWVGDMTIRMRPHLRLSFEEPETRT
jgi:hypothetical protein